ncbi:MAG: ABC transporter ATP-binding protein [Lachnospiraceae bacterium]|nr:ABC transporter ATP-binding protein [Lachnospiraceae bacterium]
MGRLEIQDLHFSYTAGEEILKGINLVLDGESTAIIGQNGAGKTTFVKLLKGLLRPTSGRILYNGKDLKDLTVAQIAQNIGMVFQNPYDLGLSDRKLVSIASIVAMNPDVIIFDEPTIAQDYAGKTRIGNIVKKLRNEGKLVLTIIHDMDFVADYFDRAVVFAKGNVLLEGNPEIVFADADVLEKAYLEQPNVTKLCHALGQEKIFLTTDAYVEYMRG